MENYGTSSLDALDFKAVGARLKELRLNTTQVEWARMANVDQGYVSQTETGKTKPSLKYLASVSATSGCSIHWILTGTGKKYLPLKHPKVKDAVQGYAANAELYYTLQQLRQDPELATTLSTLFRRKQGRRLLKQMATWDDKKMQALRLMVT